MSAVRYMLDNEHPSLPAKSGDPNIYKLGDLHGHNLVLACLPGQQGKGAAMAVAVNMSRTFPSIEWRCLVGIAGGVPDQHDIRLGDVVVSMPDEEYGGVVQYDLGKATDEGFRRKGFLWPPPSLLRSAVEMMRSEHLLADNNIDQNVRSMIEKGTGLSIYARPSATSDVLFPESYPHHPDSASCPECDQSKAVVRPRRQYSKIHFGLIASGDSVLKSAELRREMARSLGDVLCFEMEAAGLMSEYSCIVIRGISDYADSHKNNEWHHFAAAAAAAFTKELLSHLDPASAPFTNIDRQREAVLNWEAYNQLLADLRITEPRHDKRRIEETKGGLLEDSYRWILGHCDFLQWRNDPESHLLWIKGDPGKGKTMLLCGIIDELENEGPSTPRPAYFFCQATDDRLSNATAVLRSLLYILCDQHPNLVEKHIQKEYSRSGKRLFEDANSWAAMSEVLINMLTDPALDGKILIVDALDECLTDRPRLLDLIIQVSRASRAKWIVSSRNWPEVEEKLERTKEKITLRLELNEESISRAVAAYVQYKIGLLAVKKGYSDKTKDAVQQHLIDNSNDTFLWVALVCDQLQDVGIWDVEDVVKEIPAGLEDLYHRMMLQILQLGRRDPQLCCTILSTVTTTFRPLHLGELGHLSS
ncbi:hypothetical protein ACHAQH_004404 [Verticillium albo-atrum]